MTQLERVAQIIYELQPSRTFCVAEGPDWITVSWENLGKEIPERREKCMQIAQAAITELGPKPMPVPEELLDGRPVLVKFESGEGVVAYWAEYSGGHGYWFNQHTGGKLTGTPTHYSEINQEEG